MFGEMPDEDLLEEYSPRTAMGRTMQRRADEEAAQAAANGNEENEGGRSPLRRRLLNLTGICEGVLGSPCGRPAMYFTCDKCIQAMAEVAEQQRAARVTKAIETAPWQQKSVTGSEIEEAVKRQM